MVSMNTHIIRCTATNVLCYMMGNNCMVMETCMETCIVMCNVYCGKVYGSFDGG